MDVAVGIEVVVEVASSAVNKLLSATDADVCSVNSNNLSPHRSLNVTK